MFDDFKRGFWYSIGAIVGVVTLQTLADKVIPEIAAKVKTKRMTWKSLTNNLERSIMVSPLSGGKYGYYRSLHEGL